MNPVIPGDHPDPTLLKAGNDYFTTGSSFNTTPKIYHSTDLVHWEIASQPVDPGWDELDNCQACGIWGGSMAFFAGHFWDYFALKGSMWFVKADSPFGPWSTPIKMSVPLSASNGLGTDNSIFVDDDSTAYLIAKPGQDKNQIFRLGNDGQCTGEKISLDWINPAPDYPLSWAEGPVMCKKDGYYYYFVAGNAAADEYAFRSSTLTSDEAAWEFLGNILATEDRSNSLFYGPNHSSYPVQADDGSWWAIIQSYAFSWSNNEWHGQGRQGLLSRVTWTNDGKPLMSWPVNEPSPAPGFSSSGIPWMVPHSDFFDNTRMNVEWEFFGRTPATRYSLTERPGWLRLKPGSGLTHLIKNDGEHSWSLITRLDFDAVNENQEAGIRLTNGLTGVDNLDVRLYSSFKNGHKIICLKYAGQAYETRNDIGTTIWLKLIRSQHILSGYYSSDGWEWHRVGNSIDVSKLDKEQPESNGWIGNRQGLYALNNMADFDLYIYRDAYSPVDGYCPANQWGTSLSETVDGDAVLGDINDNDWAMYPGVEFGNGEYGRSPGRIEITASSAGNNGTVEVWLDSIDTGTKIGACLLGDTGSPALFETFSAPVANVEGNHDVYLRFRGAATSDLLRLKSFVFFPRLFSKYDYSKIEVDPYVIKLYLSNPVVLPGEVTGFKILVNDTVYNGTINYSLDEADAGIVNITLDREILNTDSVSLSYTGGNLVPSENGSLLDFKDKLVDNLLPGSPPRLISAKTNNNGDSLDLKFNKPVYFSDTAYNDFSIVKDQGATDHVDLTAISYENNDSTQVTLPLNAVVYAEYELFITYQGMSVFAEDGGIFAPVSNFPVTNFARGTPPELLSAVVADDGLHLVLTFNKVFTDVQGMEDFFILIINGDTCSASSIVNKDYSLIIKAKNPFRSDDVIRLSYTGGIIETVDRGVLRDFTGISIENNLPEPEFHDIPGIVEAEDYVLNSGTIAIVTSDDGGGLDIGSIDNGDYLDFALNVRQEGVYTVAARISRPYFYSEMRWQKPDVKTENLDTIPLPGSDSWSSWDTFYSLVTLEKGHQYLRMMAPEGGYKVNWFEFKTGDVLPRVLVTGIGMDPGGTLLFITFNKELRKPGTVISGFEVMADDQFVPVKSLSINPVLKNILQLTLDEQILPGTNKVSVSYSGHNLFAFDNTPAREFQNRVVFDYTFTHGFKKGYHKFFISPNPATNIIAIKSDLHYNHVDISDLGGRIVLSRHYEGYIPERTLNINLRPGYYLVRLTGKNTNMTSGLMVK
ncbi:MAG TPA: family 43 glycosylhydrolase [Bacteroidales bacterium]|nr:family 43 glycosylhydrolase [Bacteroidales bacterium]